MHKLTRKVRFSVNPFFSAKAEGYNCYASKPSGEGLSVFFELAVELVGAVEPATGFIVNVSDIDSCVRQHIVEIFSERVKKCYSKSKHVGFVELNKLLRTSSGLLADKFGAARLHKLHIALNPFRRVTIDCGETMENSEMIYFSEKFGFSAMHRLWNDEFSDERNLQVFGKCANPTGHGHNYVVEVTVRTSGTEDKFCIGSFEKIVDEELIQPLDHKNLNTDVLEFSQINPTVENIASFAWEKLKGKFEQGTLHCVTIWETDRTCCSYSE